MSKIRQKLNNNRGASFLVALLFFLICLTVGSMVLTAATAGAARTKDRYEDQQAYFAVASAARLIKEEVGTYAYTDGETWQTWQIGTDPEGEPIMESGWVRLSPVISKKDGSGGTGGDLLTDAYVNLSHIGGSGVLDEITNNFYIEPVNSADGIPPVYAEFQMKEGGHAQVVLTCDEYFMTVRFTARTAYNTDYATYKYWTTSWGEGVITKTKGAM